MSLDPSDEVSSRNFEVIPTGGMVPSNATYRGTAHMYRGEYVGHVWEYNS